MDTEPVTYVVKWPDGTRCLLDELEEYLLFMSDDFEIEAIARFNTLYTKEFLH